MKNLNSFRFLQQALEHEIDRQIDVVESGGRVVQETRLWDPPPAGRCRCAARKRRTTTAISPSRICRRVVVDAARVAAIRAAMPELPEARRRRFVDQYALSPYTTRRS